MVHVQGNRAGTGVCKKAIFLHGCGPSWCATMACPVREDRYKHAAFFSILYFMIERV